VKSRTSKGIQERVSEIFFVVMLLFAIMPKFNIFKSMMNLDEWSGQPDSIIKTAKEKCVASYPFITK
jgi:hypothetical protein